MRFTLDNSTSFELTPDDSYALVSQLYDRILPYMTSYITQEIENKLSGNVQDIVASLIDEAGIARRIAARDSFLQSLTSVCSRQITEAMLADERFNNRLFRRISDATIGVTNEAVERVTAIIQAQNNNEGDI